MTFSRVIKLADLGKERARKSDGERCVVRITSLAGICTCGLVGTGEREGHISGGGTVHFLDVSGTRAHSAHPY